MNKFLLFITILFVPLAVHSQFSMRRQSTIIRQPDSLDLKYYGKKDFLGAATQVFGVNMGVWAFNRYIANEDFARIGFNSIKTNFKKGLIWDNDLIGSNMFLHPYHGALYYNSARSRGYNFWESGAFTFAGSFMWEFFMENEYPSTNDIIVTPIGGLAMGEVLYRASDWALDDRTRGTERLKNELIGFIISPARGITRLINGDAWKVRRTSGRQFGVPPISVEASMGLRIIELEDEIFDRGTGAVFNLNMEYGDKYAHENAKPYDYFSIRAKIALQASQPALAQINVIGRIWGTDLIDSKNDFLGIGIYQHYDYYDSDTISNVTNEIPYKMANPAAFGVGLIHQSKRFSNWDFNSFVHLNAILLGGALSDHYVVSDRNYNIGSGFGLKAGINISYRDKFAVSWWHDGFRLYTWKGYPKGIDLSTVDYSTLNAQGDRSNATLNTSSIKVDVQLRKQLYLTGVGSIYRRSTHYRDYDDVYSLTGEGQLMLTYKF